MLWGWEGTEVGFSTPELPCVQLHLLTLPFPGLCFHGSIPCLPLSTPGPVGSTMHSTPGAMIHVQASLPQGILGLNSLSTHGANVRAGLDGSLLPQLLGQGVGNSLTVVFLSADEPLRREWSAVPWFANTATALPSSSSSPPSSSSLPAGVCSGPEPPAGTGMCLLSVLTYTCQDGF